MFYNQGAASILAAHDYIDEHYYNEGAPLTTNLLRYEAAQMLDPVFVSQTSIPEQDRLTKLFTTCVCHSNASGALSLSCRSCQH